MADLATLHVRIDSNQAETRLRRLRNQAKRAQDEAHGRRRRGGVTASSRAMKSFADLQGKTSTSTAKLNQKTGKLRNTFHRLGQTLKGMVIPAFGKQATATKKVRGETKETRSILGDLWKSFDRGTGAILRQVQLWGLLSAVLIGVQAAYAALGVVATRAGVTLRENAHQLNMNVQALQELQFAATSVGVSVQDLRDGLGEMSTSIVDAVKGQKAAKEAFEDLDISISTLINKGNDTNAMFDKVISRLENVDSAAKRLSIAQDIFGETAGRQALKFINRMEEARNVVDQFHGSLSDDLARSAAEVWNKIRLIWTVLKGQFIKAAAEATDTIGGLADEILRAAKRGNLFKSTLVPAINTTAAVIKGLIPIGEFLYSVVNTLANNFWYVVQAGKALIGLHLVKIFNKVTGAITAATGATGALGKAWAALSATVKGFLRMTGYYLIFEAILRIVGAVRKLNEVVAASDLTFEVAAKAMMQKFINNTIDGLETWWDRIQTAVEKVIDYIPRKMGEAGSSAWESFTSGWEKTRGAAKSERFQKQFLPKAPGPFESLWQTLTGESTKKIPQAGTSGPTQLSTSPSGKTTDQEGQGDLFGEGAKVSLVDPKEMDKLLKTLKELGKVEDVDLNIPELRDMEKLPDKLSTSTLLRHFEDINTEFGSFYDKVQDLVKEGEAGKVEEYLPLASKEIQNKIAKTKDQLESAREVMGMIEAPSHPTKGNPLGVSPEKVTETELSIAKLQAQLKKLKDQQQELGRARWTAKINKFSETFESSLDKINSKFERGSEKWSNHIEDYVAKARKFLSNIPKDVAKANKETIQEIKNTLNKLEGQTNSFENKWKDMVKGLSSSVQSWQDLAVQGFEKTFDSMAQMLTDFIMTGKMQWKDFANSVIRYISQMFIKWQMFQAVKAASSWAGIGFGAAEGAAFNNGKVMQYAKGGVVDQPTVFPMANGAGVMGEAGPEAVMPLTRTQGGDLGVKSEGGGSGVTSVEVNVINESGEPVEAREQERQMDGEKMILSVVLDAANRNKNGFAKGMKGALSKA